MASKLEQQIIKRFDIVSIAEKYQQVVNQVEVIYSRVESVESDWKTVFTDSSDVFSSNQRFGAKRETLKSLKFHAWMFVVQRTGITDFLTHKRTRQLYKQIEDNNMPEFNFYEINKFIEDAMMNAKHLVQQTAEEVYEFIKPNTGHVTNRYSKGAPPKAIITGIFDTYMSWHDPIQQPSINVNYYEKLRDLDNIFHSMDGVGIAHYPDDLKTVIESSKGSGCCETDYFRCKWYKNGNLHVEFKRMDLMNQLVNLATENTLTN